MLCGVSRAEPHRASGAISFGLCLEYVLLYEHRPYLVDGVLYFSSTPRARWTSLLVIRALNVVQQLVQLSRRPSENTLTREQGPTVCDLGEARFSNDIRSQGH